MSKDQLLISRLQDESTKQSAFSELVNTFQERLYWHIRKIVLNHDDTDDILQNTFLKAWKGIENFRADSGLFTWLYRIATNESLTFLEQKKRKSMSGLSEINEYLMENLETDPFFDGDEVQLKLQKAIASLPDKQRLVFNMRYYDDMKYQDMAKILDTSEGALKASYHHAAKKIEEHLKSAT